MNCLQVAVQYQARAELHHANTVCGRPDAQTIAKPYCYYY